MKSLSPTIGMTDLRAKLIRLAHAKPALRPALLPLLKEAAKAPVKLKGKKLDALISKRYSVLGNGVVINMMSIPKIYRAAETAYNGAATPEEAEAALDKALTEAIAQAKV